MSENKTLSVIKTALILFAITALSATLLAVLNSITAPLIAENSAKNQQEALKAVMDGTKNFEELAITESMIETAAKTGSEINSLYAAKNGSELSGYCAIITTSGYDSGLQIAAGVDLDGKVTGVKIISSNETPGLGQNAAKPEFLNQYIGKEFEISVIKSGAGDNEINAISGATMTSDGVTGAVNTLLEIAKEEQ